MMQATDFRKRDDSAALRRLDETRVWRILVERKMGPGVVVVVHVRRKDASQMAFVEDNEVVQTLPPNRADDPLDIRALSPPNTDASALEKRLS